MRKGGMGTILRQNDLNFKWIPQTDIIACGPIFDLAGEDVCAWTLITPPGIVATKLRWNTMGWEPFQVQKVNIINYDIGTWCRLAGMRNTAGRCVLGTRVRFKTPTLRYICFAVSYQHLLAIPEPHKNYIPHKKFFFANDDKWGR